MAKSNHERINQLIEETEDPVQRAVLLVLSGIAHDLDSNTMATERIATAVERHTLDFQRHDKQEQHDRAYIRGAMWAGVVFVAAIQIAGGWVISRYVNANDAQLVTIQALERRLISMEAKLTK